MAVKVTEQIDNKGITDFYSGEFRDRRTPMFDKTKTDPDALRKYQFIKLWKLIQLNEKKTK